MAWKYADELAEEYINDLKPLRAIYGFYRERRDNSLRLVKDCENYGEWELAAEYRNEYREYKMRASEISSIISSCQYSIQWLKEAKEPGNRREIGRRSRYQRTIYFDDMDKLFVDHFREDYAGLSDEELQKLNDYLNCLSDQEKLAFISVKGQGNSYEETAQYLGVSRSTVQSYVNRGMKKLEEALICGAQTSLF